MRGKECGCVFLWPLQLTAVSVSIMGFDYSFRCAWISPFPLFSCCCCGHPHLSASRPSTLFLPKNNGFDRGSMECSINKIIILLQGSYNDVQVIWETQWLAEFLPDAIMFLTHYTRIPNVHITNSPQCLSVTGRFAAQSILKHPPNRGPRGEEKEGKKRRNYQITLAISLPKSLSFILGTQHLCFCIGLGYKVVSEWRLCQTKSFEKFPMCNFVFFETLEQRFLPTIVSGVVNSRSAAKIVLRQTHFVCFVLLLAVRSK